MKQMLDGIKVLDFTATVAGAGAAAMLADYGASVLKIEPPGGDPLRAMSPRMEGVSLTHCWFNRGKQSLVLDFRRAEDVETARSLMEKADVVIEDSRPGTMARWGLDYEHAAARNPGLIYCAVTWFGQKGPYSRKAGRGS